MYLHIGSGYVVRFSELIGIFDIENTSVSKSTQRFLYEAERGGRVEYVSMDIPKSFVVTTEKVYVSPISAATLRKRAGAKTIL